MGRMHRARWAHALEGLLDNEIDERVMERVLAHLEGCTDCLADLEELVRLQRSLRRLSGAA